MAEGARNPALDSRGKIKAIMFDPVHFTFGLEPEDALHKLADEFALKTMTEPRRETSLVLTKLEEALAWERRRLENIGAGRFTRES